MFDKTINRIKDLAKTEHDVVIKVDNESTDRLANKTVKSFAQICGLIVVTSISLHVIDAVHPHSANQVNNES